jgi:hypothetical protein
MPETCGKPRTSVPHRCPETHKTGDSAHLITIKQKIHVLTSSQMQGDNADEGLAARFQSLQSILATQVMRDVFGPRVGRA